MSFEKVAEKLFQMSEEVWVVHANPWSVWTRYPCLPLLVLAVWSRVWCGWFSLIPILAVLVWVWINPRVFGKPKSTNNWASKAVMGERILLNHPQEEIPKHHLVAIRNLKFVMLIGFVMTVYGLVVLHPWMTAAGSIIVILGKSWFLDRMVWLFEDLKQEREEYQNWLY